MHRTVTCLILSGLCGPAVAGNPASQPAQAPEATVLQPEVTTLLDVPVRVAPRGGASIQVLALGEQAFVGRLVLPPNAQVPEHRDATEEFIHVLEGSGTLWIDGESHAVGPGSTAFMPANALVRFVNDGQPMIALQVFADPDPAAKYDTWKPAESTDASDDVK